MQVPVEVVPVPEPQDVVEVIELPAAAESSIVEGPLHLALVLVLALALQLVLVLVSVVEEQLSWDLNCTKRREKKIE